MVKISVLTPTYNRCTLLPRLYESLVAQDFENMEWIVVDDGSVDETKQTVQDFIREGKIAIKYIHKENGGKPSAHNVGVQAAESNLTVICDDDDYFVGGGAAHHRRILGKICLR